MKTVDSILSTPSSSSSPDQVVVCQRSAEMSLPVAGDYTGQIPAGYDVEALRERFPGLKSETISMNNGAGSVCLGSSIDAIVNFMSKPQIQLDDGDEFSDKCIAERDVQFAKIASYINAGPDEIAFGQSSTALFRLLAQALRPSMSADSEMIVSMLCHEAGLTAWIDLARNLGITIKWWAPPPPPRDGDGTNPRLSLETLKPLLTPKTRLVACGHVNNNFGSIHPIREIADLVHQIPGALLSVDGVAWAPHRPIDVKALGVDFYTFSWYKVFGPHFAQLYARRGVHRRHVRSLNHYHLEPTTLDAKLGLGTNMHELEDSLVPIIDYLDEVGWSSIIDYEAVLCKPLIDYLVARPDTFTVYGEKSSDPELRVSCVCFKIRNVSSYDFCKELHNSSSCRIVWGDNYSMMAIHDLLGLDDAGIVRCSLVHYNTVDEVVRLVAELDRVVSLPRFAEQIRA